MTRPEGISAWSASVSAASAVMHPDDIVERNQEYEIVMTMCPPPPLHD